MTGSVVPRQWNTGPHHVRRQASRFLSLLTILLLVTGCRSDDARAGTRAITFNAPPADSMRLLIIERLERGERSPDVDEHVWEHVRAVYEARQHEPVWTVERGFSERAAILLGEVSRAAEDGLRPDRYPLDELERTLHAHRGGGAPPVEAIVGVELLLMALLAAYGEDMLTGRVDPRRVDRSWHIDPNEVDVDSALVRLVRAADFGEALASLRPQDEDYAALRRELARYRQLSAKGGWERIETDAVLRPGDTSEVVSALRARLRSQGFLGDRTAGHPQLYDDEVAAAVYDFQRRHGIAADSIFGPETRRTMNVPAESRVRQIEGNLERWRWLPHALGARYLVVNVPAFRLHGYEGDEQVIEMNVIVGEEYTATPVFADSMSFLEFYPYWHIPMSIARRTILPQAARDPGYLSRNGYEIVRQWTNEARPIPVSSLSRAQLQPANFPYRLRQRPGPHNALGLVKFMFPNEFAIYLHDTPAGQLFDERVRTFSNGCIRVQDPVGLAEWVLRPNGGWDSGRIRSAMQGPTRRVDLAEKVPIYIVYLTSYVSGGELIFRPDIYGRDNALMDALGEAPADGRAAQVAAALAELLG